MTTSPPVPLPLHTPDLDGAEAFEKQVQRAAGPAALHRGADAGEEAARWVRELAGRQCEEGHARALERVAEAITRASSREIIPAARAC
ncbi:hypothetical protein ACFV0O_40945 [Kitasatospora sp. NPDC059577]|uniref:hypothetical protein n=1 Tax=Kitasatospora sp. NPDC059577 TaxID=3346873 RepID=UPI00367FD56C